MRVLCVSPRFAPASAADNHRLRLLLPYFAALGWEAEVLAVESSDVPGPQDDWLAQRLPPSVPIHRVRAWQSAGWGVNGLAQRSFAALHRKGCALLRDKRFDLVFFSTTEFLLHALGPLWQRRHGVPFCMDFQDPWVNDYYARHPNVVPPGGRLKFALAHRIHCLAEQAVVGRCSGFLSVSPAYLEALDTRYGKAVAGAPRYVAGFPAEPGEQHAAAEAPTAAARGGERVWRYIGRGGPDMAVAARAFFLAWRQAIDSGLLAADAVRFEAIGTSYDTSGQSPQTLRPLALEAGLDEQVMEQAQRLPYSEMLRRLAASDALIVFGSDDPAYTASKIYPYLLAGKPLLGLFHRRSGVVELLNRVGGGTCVTFDASAPPEALTAKIVEAWFSQGDAPAAVALDKEAFAPYTASAQATATVRWFNDVIEFARRRA